MDQKPPGTSDAARLLAALRQRVTRTCLRCGRPIEGVRTKRFCSPTCTSAYWQKTHRERVNAYRRRKTARTHSTPTPPAE